MGEDLVSSIFELLSMPFFMNLFKHSLRFINKKRTKQIILVIVLFGISLIRSSLQKCIPKPQSIALEASVKLDDSDTLNVLAYNIQMRPQFLFADGQSQRAILIAEQLKHYQEMYDIDVIIFSEAFDGRATEKLLNKLYALSHDRWYKTNQLGGRDFVQNGGVIILSKWEIEEQDQLLFKGKCVAFDCLADKGVVYAQISKQGQIYHLFGSHTQAGNSKKAQAVRKQQLEMIRNFIDSKNIPVNEVVIVGGDLNVDKLNYKDNEYKQMLNILKVNHPQLKGEIQYTIDPSNQMTTSETKKYLDYVLYSSTHLEPEKSFNEVLQIRSERGWKQFKWFYWQCQKWNLSDHYAVYGQFNL